jgi:hypothetical protein
MNERQQAHIAYFLERLKYWEAERPGVDKWQPRLLAARDADNTYPLRTEEEGSEVFVYLTKLDKEGQPGEPPN